MIKKINNPKTKEYLLMKQEIFTPNFSWYWNSESVPKDPKNNSLEHISIPFLSHGIIVRPKDDSEYSIFPKINSQYSDIFNVILDQIFDCNQIDFNCVLRINVNLTIPLVGVEKTRSHVDHNFPHKNLLIYLNNSDGDTILCDDEEKVLDTSSPIEDKVILFEGKHYHYLPSKGRRIVIVCTFI